MDSSQKSYPLVAIVTPVYNGERYLRETMSCVQSLDYPNLVHVVLDNASTDATPKIILEYLNDRVIVLTKRNPTTIPMIQNFNAAIRLIPESAAYFRLLCADDLMTVDAIRRMVELGERYPSANIIGCLEHSDKLRDESVAKDRELFDGKAIVHAYLRRENSILSGTHFLFRRSLLHQAHSFYDETLLSHADADASIRACISGDFAFIHDGLGIWRYHESNAWHEHTRLRITTVDWLQILMRYGHQILRQDEYRDYVSSYRRHCLRQLLLLRWRDKDKATYNHHLDTLRKAGDNVTSFDFAIALIDWVILALTGRRHTVGTPINSAFQKLGSHSSAA